MNIGNGIRIIKYTENRIKVMYKGTCLGYCTATELDSVINSIIA